MGKTEEAIELWTKYWKLTRRLRCHNFKRLLSKWTWKIWKGNRVLWHCNRKISQRSIPVCLQSHFPLLSGKIWQRSRRVQQSHQVRVHLSWFLYMESQDSCWKGRHWRGQKSCDEFLAIAEDASVYDMKGQIYLHEYNYPEAIKLFDKAIEVDPSYEDSYINKSIACICRKITKSA